MKAKTVQHEFARKLRWQMSRAEVLLWSRLRRRAVGGWKFRRQHPIGPYIADFACLARRLVIEVDGATHCTERELAYDSQRDTFMQKDGWRILRFRNGAIYESLDEVLACIRDELSTHGLPDYDSEPADPL